jgi:sterol desaturase/sphingolipid hydroxylase (fatty acid hydroxylase superfamily)
MDRILAAVIAPIAFNVSTFIVAAVIYKSLLFSIRTQLTHSLFSTGYVIVFVFLPSIIGFLFGTSGFISFLGHSFYTHMEGKRNFLITMGIWSSMVISATWITHNL